MAHDPFRHIGQQLLKFAISYKGSCRAIKKFLIDEINEDSSKLKIVEQGLIKANYKNIDAFFEDILFEKEVRAIVIIDKSTPDLEKVVNQLTMKIDILEFKKFSSGNDEVIYKFTPFIEEIRDIPVNKEKGIDPQKLDTIVAPANEEGFNKIFLSQDSWYAIRISSSMIDRIKYIASYQTSPISAITHYAEVSRIEKYKDTGKYILYFKEPAKEIKPIKMDSGELDKVPQGPRYTTFEKLMKAKTLDDVF